MKKFPMLLKLIICLIGLFQNKVNAQTENLDPIQEQLYWMPDLLQSNFSGLHELAQFHGFALNWVPRGLVNSKGNFINGINWGSNLNGWDPNFTYAGMYGEFKTLGHNTPYGISAFGLSEAAGNNFISSDAALFSKSKSVSYRLSNANTLQEFRANWHSGVLKNGYWINIASTFQKTPTGYLVNGFKDRKSMLFSLKKNLSDKHQFGLNFWWSPVTQSKRAPTVQEAFTLSQDPLYNPSWGWLNGQAFYANTKKSNAPVLSLHYTFNSNKGNNIQIHFGTVWGTQSSTQLDWAKAADPRPDYYKYLPSFAGDSLLKKRLLNWFAIHPELLQVQFDPLVLKNLSSTNGAAKYIINERIQRLQLFRLSMTSSYSLGYSIYWHAGWWMHWDKIGYRNQIANLLGGRFYYNYNTWVNEDGLATAYQHDMILPDRKIKLGEAWGPYYFLMNQQLLAWTSLIGSTRFVEWGLGMQMGADLIQRKGMNQNGLFPSSSKGLSAVSFFPTNQYQFYIRYKFNGRWYATTRFFQGWKAPDAAELFADAANHDIRNPFLFPLIQVGAEIKVQYMGSNIKASATFFAQSNQNERQFNLFYHDYYNAFVRASLGQMKTMHQGIEIYVESNWSSPIQFSLANSIGWYNITNRPLYEIRLADNLYKVESGRLLLNHFPATAYPQSVQAFTLHYQPRFSMRFSYTMVYSSRRAISHDLFRRNSWVKEHNTMDQAWESMYLPVWAPNQWVSNLFLSKSFQVKSSKRNTTLRLTASIRNLWNELIPSLIFEQSRYDYKNFELEKFPAKYLYDPGRTYTLGIQLVEL